MMNHIIDSGALFDAIDKLKVDDNYFAIAFGIYLDYYTGKAEKLKKESERIYSYNGMTIMLLDCPTQYFSKRIYIMRKDDRPYIDFQEPSEDQKAEMQLKKFSEYGLWMSIQRVEGHEKALSEEYFKKLGDEKNMYSLFHVIWAPKLFFKEKYNKICLKVYYKTTDEGTADPVDKIKPFEVPQE